MSQSNNPEESKKCVVRAAPAVPSEVSTDRLCLAPEWLRAEEMAAVHTDTEIHRYKQMENTGNKIMSKIAGEFSTLCTFLHRAADRYVDTQSDVSP